MAAQVDSAPRTGAPHLRTDSSRREIGEEAVWSLSTAKPGNGVDQLRDGSPDTYWQSDGGQPHLINVQFQRKASICEVAFYLDFGLDESYTPKKISIRAGSTFHDRQEIHVEELNEPSGSACPPPWLSEACLVWRTGQLRVHALE